MADKYIVFKIEDWDKTLGTTSRQFLESLAVPDAVVIRRQDVFSPPALDAYANTLFTTVEALKAGKGGYNERLVKHLTEVADYFHEQATLAWDTNRKMPD